MPSARQLVYGDRRANPDGPAARRHLDPPPAGLPEGFQADEDTWYFPRVCGTFKERAGWHGCQMPEQLLGRIIRACSNEGELVLDPFAGSGTTLAVAKKLNRRFIGFELSEQYAMQVEKAAGGDPARRSLGRGGRAAHQPPTTAGAGGVWTRSAATAAVAAAREPFRPRSTSARLLKFSGASMKFAICNETFQDWPFERAFAFAADCGYTGIEIAPFTMARDATQIPPGRRDEVRRQADAAGLEVVGLHWLLAKTEGFHLTSPDRGVRPQDGRLSARVGASVPDLGGKVMVFGSPQQRNLLPGVSREQAMEYAAEVFRGVVPTLEANDVVVALEPLGPQETNFLVTTAETVELAERIGSPRCDCTWTAKRWPRNPRRRPT